jgi:hypothetical protein
LEELINHYDTDSDEICDCINDFQPETVDIFREGLRILKTARVYAQRVDWLISGDDNEADFNVRLSEELSKI